MKLFSKDLLTKDKLGKKIKQSKHCILKQNLLS